MTGAPLAASDLGRRRGAWRGGWSLPIVVVACRHPRATMGTAHHRGAGGRTCSHLETCDECGVVVASESWKLTGPGGKAHAAAYPPPPPPARRARRAPRRKGAPCK